ncbi:hypothetical protein DFO70_110163 [Cytobacillus firmus]|uniref:Uncharacterized protein n=2 Tax=Cytobacillus TaxID=2675230 RepID=A0A366JR29_CYTFI|nr:MULTISPECIES: ABA4-like family protein [Cytobacillus]RBP90057.1 hypothetical protein DFO70_110163 [Cytobacillus firmus]TDX40505.1 hypothetical protein DFO72_109174 [Cytobacillus oceanisediminis]
MDAVSTVYRIVSEELEKESVSIERILESIKEPMLVIDDNYADTLERADCKKEGDFMSFDQCRDIASLMTGFTKPWFVAGGGAIDLFVGRETRNH